MASHATCESLAPIPRAIGGQRGPFLGGARRPALKLRERVGRGEGKDGRETYDNFWKRQNFEGGTEEWG